MKIRLGMMVLAFAMSGCFHYKYTTTAKPGTAAPNDMHIGVIGLVEISPVSVGSKCPGGFATVESTNYLVGMLDLNSVTSTCVEGSQPATK